jgi:NAD dependent epimerase/dehydratase family enzyme
MRAVRRLRRGRGAAGDPGVGVGRGQQCRDALPPEQESGDDCLARLPLHGFIVQPSLVYGKEGASARTFKTLASMPLCLRLGTAPQLVQPVHVDDVAAAIASLVRASPPPGAAQRVALVGPASMPFIDYLAALRTAMGMGRLRVLTLPGWANRLAARLARFVPG